MNRTLTILIFAFLCNSCEKDLVKTIDGSNVKASFNCLPETDIKVAIKEAIDWFNEHKMI